MLGCCARRVSRRPEASLPVGGAGAGDRKEQIPGRAGAFFCIFWGEVSEDSDGPMEWCRPVPAALEATDFHPGRSGRDHLRMLGQAVDVPDTRTDEVLRLVELGDAARRRVKGYSLGMRQRLGLAVALLGDPELLILDEPANGLDPEGVRWLRDFLRSLPQRAARCSSQVMCSPRTRPRN